VCVCAFYHNLSLRIFYLFRRKYFRSNLFVVNFIFLFFYRISMEILGDSSSEITSTHMHMEIPSILLFSLNFSSFFQFFFLVALFLYRVVVVFSFLAQIDIALISI